MRRVALIVIAATGCGSSTPSPTAGASPIVLVATPAAGDVEVARVNGRPVWGSCVTAQASGARLATDEASRARALAECIDFELLAQTAERRGLASGPEVSDALRTALVDRLIADFEQRYQKPADLGPVIEKLLDANPHQQNVPERRTSTYVRVPIAETAPADQDAIAHAFSDQIAARVVNERGLFPSHLIEAAKSVTPPPGFKLEHADIPMYAAVQLHQSYASVLFAIPEIGRVGGPVRTQWGWDIMLWTGGVPAKTSTREELAAEVFPRLRRNQFGGWIKQLERGLGIKVEVVEANLPKLETVGGT